MKKIIYFLLPLVFLTSCTSSVNLTRGANYSKMYQEKPVAILVMPPINKTVNVEAKEYFYTSMAMPLCEKGYYVISPFLAMDLLKSESAYDSEMFLENNLLSFKNVFGADAVLFTTINKWSKSALGNTISVEITYALKSTATNEVLFERQGALTVDTSISSGSGGGLGLLVDMVASAVNTALTDKVIAARRCNSFVLYDLPEGQYSPMSGKDQSTPAGNATFSGTVKQ